MNRVCYSLCGAIKHGEGGDVLLLAIYPVRTLRTKIIRCIPNIRLLMASRYRVLAEIEFINHCSQMTIVHDNLSCFKVNLIRRLRKVLFVFLEDLLEPGLEMKVMACPSMIELHV